MPAFHHGRQGGFYLCIDCTVDANLVLVKYPGVARVHKLAGAEQVVFKTWDHVHFICWRVQVSVGGGGSWLSVGMHCLFGVN